MNTNRYINYGDCNPLEHGGIWVLQENTGMGITTQYGIVKNIFDADSEKIYLYDLGIDISDEWLDKKAVMLCTGMTEQTFDNVQFAIACIDYYSFENFGTKTELDTIEELTEELKAYGIEV